MLQQWLLLQLTQLNSRSKTKIVFLFLKGICTILSYFMESMELEHIYEVLCQFWCANLFLLEQFELLSSMEYSATSMSRLSATISCSWLLTIQQFSCTLITVSWLSYYHCSIFHEKRAFKAIYTLILSHKKGLSVSTLNYS